MLYMIQVFTKTLKALSATMLARSRLSSSLKRKGNRHRYWKNNIRTNQHERVIKYRSRLIGYSSRQASGHYSVMKCDRRVLTASCKHAESRRRDAIGTIRAGVAKKLVRSANLASKAATWVGCVTMPLPSAPGRLAPASRSSPGDASVGVSEQSSSRQPRHASFKNPNLYDQALRRPRSLEQTVPIRVPHNSPVFVAVQLGEHVAVRKILQVQAAWAYAVDPLDRGLLHVRESCAW